VLAEGNLEDLSEKGQKLQESIRQQKKKIKILMKEETLKKLLFEDEPYSNYPYDSYLNVDNIPMKPTTTSDLKELGKKAQATRDKELALTVERLQDLHGSLITCPSEDEKAEDPKGLKVQLMPHQQHALAWLLWRERQRPSGGILGNIYKSNLYHTLIVLIYNMLN